MMEKQKDDYENIVDLLHMLGYIREKDRKAFDMILPLMGTLLQNQINLIDTGTIREKRGSGT